MNLKPATSALLAASFVLTLNGCASQSHTEKHHYTPGLGEIMSLTSMRHAKLWFAGQGQNWDLAEYELEELQEGFEDAGAFHPTHKDIKEPIPQLITKTMDAAVAGLAIAVKAKNVALFTQHFDAVTAGCNACHQATAFGFNVVTRPSFNPFANQAFTSSVK